MSERQGSPDAGARRCIASGVSRPRDALLRFVVGPGGALVPDLGEIAAGAGLVDLRRARPAGEGLRARTVRPRRAAADRRGTRPDRRSGAAAGRACAGCSGLGAARGRPRHGLRQGAAGARRGARGRPGGSERRRPARPGTPRRARAGHSRDRALRWRHVEPQSGPWRMWCTPHWRPADSPSGSFGNRRGSMVCVQNPAIGTRHHERRNRSR